QGPVLPFNSSVPPVLFRVPVRLMVPPLRVYAPRAAVLNVPPRFSVESASVIWPVFDQLLPPRASVPPLRAARVAALLQPVPLRLNAPPAPATIIPRLRKVPDKLPWPPCTVTFGPMVSVGPPATLKVFESLPPNTTAPTPPRTWSPLKDKKPEVVPMKLPRLAVPLRVSPLVIVSEMDEDVVRGCASALSSISNGANGVFAED